MSDNSISIMTYVVKDGFWPSDLTLAMNRSNYSQIYGKVQQYKDTMMARINAAK